MLMICTRIILDCRDRVISIPRAQSVQYMLPPHSKFLTTIFITIVSIISSIMAVTWIEEIILDRNCDPVSWSPALKSYFTSPSATKTSSAAPPKQHSPVESVIRALLRAGQPPHSTPLRYHSHLAAYQTYHLPCALFFNFINYLSRILGHIWLPFLLSIIFSINVGGILSWDGSFSEIPWDSGDLKVVVFVKRPTTRYFVSLSTA